MGVIKRGTKAASIVAQVNALERVVELDFNEANDGEMDIEEMPGCCSIAVISGFVTDGRVEDYISNCLDEYEEKKEEDDPAVSKEAAISAVHDLFLSALKEEGTGEYVTALTLSDEQETIQKLAVEAGFEAAYTYPGKDGKITVYFREN